VVEGLDAAGRGDYILTYEADGSVKTWTNYDDNYLKTNEGVYDSNGHLDAVIFWDTEGHVIEFQDWNPNTGAEISDNYYSNGNGDSLDDNVSSGSVDFDFSEPFDASPPAPPAANVITELLPVAVPSLTNPDHFF
jgi:hypothetical protein